MSAEIEIGFFSFSQVTDPVEHRSYNEWHQLDHLPEQYRITGVVHGQRWVCTPACKSARTFDAGRLEGAQYVTLYLMTAPVDRTLEQFGALGRELHDLGRFHERRRSLLSGPFAVLGARAARRALVSAEVLPYRPNLGVYVIVEAAAGAALDAVAWHDEVAGRLVELPGVAGVIGFASRGDFEHLGWHPGDVRVSVCYLDEPPLEVCATVDPVVLEIFEGRSTPELAGPFETITPWEWGWFDA
ncbi:MAG TPA: hypothetical protein VMR97_15250 [Acidimicrobiales bacterium]|nr:hypothetical protein [Acidimicrobiales bacterium]